MANFLKPLSSLYVRAYCKALKKRHFDDFAKKKKNFDWLQKRHDFTANIVQPSECIFELF
jgi:hypothetical protein